MKTTLIAVLLEFAIVACLIGGNNANAQETYVQSADINIDGLQRSALTSMAITTDWREPPDEDHPGVGGGQESVSYFRKSLVALVPKCTSQMVEVFTQWLNQHSLFAQRSERLENSFIAYASRDGLNGIFEFTYRVDLDAEKARTSLYFYSNDGEKHELNNLKNMLADFGVNDLQDMIGDTLQCGS
jgi:hypothetical protein